jgi:hypothetical protein
MLKSKMFAVTLTCIGYANSAQAVIPEDMFFMIDHGFKSTPQYRQHTCEASNYSSHAYCSKPDKETILESKKYLNRRRLFDGVYKMGYNQTITQNTVIIMAASNPKVKLIEIKKMVEALTFHINNSGLEAEPDKSKSKMFSVILKSLRSSK